MVELNGKYLSVKEASVRLSLGIETVRRYIARGTIKAIKIPGGYYRIPESELTKITQPEAQVTQPK